MRRMMFLLSAMVCMILGNVSWTWARTTIAPHLTVREEYNDNIFLSATGRQDDFITRVRPGLAISWPSNYLRLNIDYGFDFLVFADHSDLNETSFSDTQRGVLDAELFPGRDFSVLVKDEISRVTVDERLPVTSENTFLHKTNLNDFVVNPRYRFRSIPTLEATIGYQYENLSYSAPSDPSLKADDSNTHSGTFDLTKSFSPRFKILLDYGIHFHQARYSEDFRRQDLTGGISYRLGPRLTFLGKGGATKIDFEYSGDHTFGIWQTRLDFRATDRATYSLEYSNGFLISVDNGLFQREAAVFLAEYKAKVVSRCRLFANDDTYRSIDREDRSAGGVVSAIFPLIGDLNLNLSGNYTYYRFLPEMEDVQRYGIGWSLEYVHKIYFCSLGYVYQKGTSNFASNDFNNNIAYLQVGVNFGAKDKENKFLSSLR